MEMSLLSSRDSLGRAMPNRTMIRQNEIPAAGPVCVERKFNRRVSISIWIGL